MRSGGRIPRRFVVDGYDFIVVGGGTAGCVLAARLSEDADSRVLLLEAGSRQPPETAPAAWTTLQGTSADWADTSVVQTATGTTIPWPRGRGLGGSSAINGMCFIRGHRSSYDAWVTAGAKGWGFDDLLPYMMRSEHAEGRDPRSCCCCPASARSPPCARSASRSSWTFPGSGRICRTIPGPQSSTARRGRSRPA